jgi:hypothetical protein
MRGRGIKPKTSALDIMLDDPPLSVQPLNPGDMEGVRVSLML